MINQLTVFLENDKGRLAALCRTLGEAGISMHALTVADTSDYGVARIICDDPEAARDLLQSQGYRATLIGVFAIGLPDQAGSLADLLEALEAANLNLEYAYCFKSEDGRAIDILRIEQADGVPATVLKAGFKLLDQEDIYR